MATPDGQRQSSTVLLLPTSAFSQPVVKVYPNRQGQPTQAKVKKAPNSKATSAAQSDSNLQLVVSVPALVLSRVAVMLAWRRGQAIIPRSGGSVRVTREDANV
jgi:hypothetical protein